MFELFWEPDVFEINCTQFFIAVNLSHKFLSYYISFEMHNMCMITLGWCCPSTWIQFSSLGHKLPITGPIICCTSSHTTSFCMVVVRGLWVYILNCMYFLKKKSQLLKSGNLGGHKMSLKQKQPFLGTCLEPTV